MVRRAMESAPADSEIDFTPHVKRVFETIGMAKYSTSAAEARRMGFLMPADTVTINRDRLIQDAKTTLLEMVREGYCQPERRDDLIALGEPTLALLKLGLHQMVRGGFISEYDAHVGRKLAEVLTGGSRAARSRVSEQHFLDLEREAFLSLCGEPKTQERIQHMLKNGKPLRN